MHSSFGLTLAPRVGDSYLSPVWAVVIGGEGVDLDGDGWTVNAQARNRAGEVVIDFGALGLVLLAEATVAVDTTQVTTSTVRLYIPPARSAQLDEPLRFDVEIVHPTFGPLEDTFRATIASGVISPVADVTVVA